MTRPLEAVVLRLSDYCCRCGKMFANAELLSIIRTGEIARAAHTGCTSTEDDHLLMGTWQYLTLESAKGRR